MISKSQVYAHIKKSGNLPTLPEILLKLLDACDDENTPLTEVASIIKKDPALSFKVLQLINSSYYGMRSTFTGIEQAVVYLGANVVKNIAITSSVHQVFNRKRLLAVKQFDFNGFWWHSLMCATLAKRIAKRTGYNNVDEAYLSGMLHDIGRLVLVSTYPKEHEIIFLKTKDIQNVLWAETQFIGITHCEAGSWLVQNWRLNSLMANAIRYHHEVLENIKEAFPLVKIVYLSNLLSNTGLADEKNCNASDVLFGLAGADLTSIIEGANDEVLEIARNLEINIKPPSTNGNKGNMPSPPANGEEGLPQDTEPDVPDANPIAQAENQRSQIALTARIKNITLLSGFLENLVQAGESEAILAVFEQAMSILFNIQRVLFFLPDKDAILLKGRTSAANDLHPLSQGLVLPVQRSTSGIVKSYTQGIPVYLTKEHRKENLADEQVFSIIKCKTVLIIPIVADRKPAGVVLLGLPDTVKVLPSTDNKLIQVIAQQVGLCLYLEKMKARKAEEIEAERMSAVSMTARKFAHEINNPLGIISNYLTAMRLKLAEEDSVLKDLDIIGEELQRISSMINQMDMFSQKMTSKFEMTDVNAVLGNIIQFVKKSLLAESGTVIIFTPGPSLPQVPTSGDAIKQIMINLLKNASEAMGNGGKIEVRTGIAQIGLAECTDAMPQDGIEIVVEDEGPGLPEEVKRDLYKPFVTTKGDGHSGLGLSIVHKAVKDLGGTIACVSRPAGGTTFTIILPQKERTAHNP